jgi:hypothetical protein
MPQNQSTDPAALRSGRIVMPKSLLPVVASPKSTLARGLQMA